MFATSVGYANNVKTVALAEACEQNVIDFHGLYEFSSACQNSQ
jgi:hypothetical protein